METSLLKALQDARSRTPLHQQLSQQSTFATASIKMTRGIPTLSAMQHTSNSAVHRVPSEIWAKIFRQVLCTQHLYAPAHTSFFPLLPRRVCHEWRQIADSTPPLWTHLYIFGHNQHDSTPLSVRAWIQRAGSLDFHFHVVDLDVDREGSTPMFFDDLVSALWPYLERLRSLAAPDFFTARLPSGRLTRLQNLLLNVSTFARLGLPDTNSTLDKLHMSSLSTTGGRLPVGMTPLRSPWSQLSRLALHCFIGDLEILGQILQGCMRLMAFELHGYGTRLYLTQEHQAYRANHGAHGPPRFLLPGLRSLHLRTDIDRDMELFLEGFGMPDLRILRIDLTRSHDFWYKWHSGLCECVSRSPNIQTLSVSGISGSCCEHLRKMIENCAGHCPLEIRIVPRGSSIDAADIALDTSSDV